MSAFFDTNVLIYAVDGRFPEKQSLALALVAQELKTGSFVISTQVLIEFFNATTKAGIRGKTAAIPLLSRQQAQLQVASLARYRVINTTPTLVVAATDLAMAHGMQWFDALMVQAALSCGAATLYSEDMQHRRQFGALTVINPFVGQT